MADKIFKTKAYKTVNLSPFINNKSTLRTCLYILGALIPQLIMLFVTKSFSNICLIAVSILAVGLAQSYDIYRKKNYKLAPVIILTQGIITGFFLPAGFSPLTAFFVIFVFSAIVQYAFGGFSNSWLNPVVICVAACWFICSVAFPEFLVTKDYIMSKNPSLALIQTGVIPTYGFDEKYTTFLNESIFSMFRVLIPHGYVSFFWDSGAIIPAFRFNFLTLIASIFLISTNVVDYVIPFLYLTVYSILVKIFCPVFAGGMMMQGDVILAVLSSGTLFTAFFLLQWFGTTPLSVSGKIAYGITAGILAFIFSGCGTSPVGSIMTVLFLNIFSTVLVYFENKKRKAKLVNAMRNENA